MLLGVPSLPRGARFPPRVGSPTPCSAGTATGSAACGEGTRGAPGWLWPLLRSLQPDLSAGRVPFAGEAWVHPLLPLPPALPPLPAPAPVGEKAKGLTGVATSATLPRGVGGTAPRLQRQAGCRRDRSLPLRGSLAEGLCQLGIAELR